MSKKTHVVHSFFPFFISSNFEYHLVNAVVYVDIDQGILKVKLKLARNEKTTWVFLFLYMKYGKTYVEIPKDVGHWNSYVGIPMSNVGFQHGFSHFCPDFCLI